MKKAFSIFYQYGEIWCKDEKQCDERVKMLKDIYAEYEQGHKYSAQKIDNKKGRNRFLVVVNAPGKVWRNDICRRLDIGQIDMINWA